jgi:hypothetical protein
MDPKILFKEKEVVKVAVPTPEKDYGEYIEECLEEKYNEQVFNEACEHAFNNPVDLLDKVLPRPKSVEEMKGAILNLIEEKRSQLGVPS